MISTTHTKPYENIKNTKNMENMRNTKTYANKQNHEKHETYGNTIIRKIRKRVNAKNYKQI